MRKLCLALLLLANAGCMSSPFDASILPPGYAIDGYQSWSASAPITTTVPGHGATFRIVHFNPAAEGFAGGRYPVGSILVKDIFARKGDGPGDLQVSEIMRKVGVDSMLPAPIEEGWIFTEIGAGATQEVHVDTCYPTCHRLTGRPSRPRCHRRVLPG